MCRRKENGAHACGNGVLRAHPVKMLGCAQVGEDRRLSWENSS
jgi:hypothetical protein